MIVGSLVLGQSGCEACLSPASSVVPDTQSGFEDLKKKTTLREAFEVA